MWRLVFKAFMRYTGENIHKKDGYMKKRIFITFIVMFVVYTCFGFVPLVYATANIDSIENSGETVYIKNYEEYEALMKEVNQNEVNKEEYFKQLIDELKKQDSYTATKLYQARVISIGEPEEQYTQDQATTTYSRGYYQNGKVEIINDENLEGITLNYMICLTYDVYGNITMPQIKVGDVVNVSFMQIDEGTVVAFSPEPDTYVKRFPSMMVLVIFSLLVVIGILGKYSVSFIIPTLLMFDLVICVLAPNLFLGIPLWVLVFFAIVLTTIAICVLKLGANIKAITAIFTTIIISAVIIPIHFVVDAIFNFSGLTTESFLMSGGVLPDVIANEIISPFSFHSLSIAITSIMAFALIALVACKVGENYEDGRNTEERELIEDKTKAYVADMSFVAMVILIATTLPKYMLLIAKKYTTAHVVHSEMLLIEFVRMLIILLAIALTIPTTKLVSKFFEE